MDQRIEKLPKWAREEMQRMERETDRMETIYRQWHTKGPNDNTFWRIGYLDDKPIGECETIRFQIGENYWEYIDARVEDGRVMIMGGSSIDIQTKSGNYVTIGTVDR